MHASFEGQSRSTRHSGDSATTAVGENGKGVLLDRSVEKELRSKSISILI